MYYEAWGLGDRRKSPAVYYHSLQIAHATSTDGIHWTKDPANPVIAHGPELYDKSGAWDPFVLYEDGKFKLWYGAGSEEPGSPLCPWAYAESTDGWRFVKKGLIDTKANIPHVEDDKVVHDTNTGHYFMYYLNQIGLTLYRAESPDENHFDYSKSLPLHFKGFPPHGFPKYPQAFQVDGKWYMLFGRPGGGSVDDFTGLATSPDGLNWTVKNAAVFPRAHDSALLKVADDLYLIFHGPNKQQDEVGCDIRLAVFKGAFTDMLQPKK